MEISLRKALLVLLLLGLLAITGKIIHERVTEPAAGEPAPELAITFADESAAWDWQAAACADPLATFVKDASAVHVVLIDAATELPLAAAYPDLGAPDGAVAAALCTRSDTATALLCQVNVRAGSGANLDVAAGAALAYALQEDARPKTLEAFEARPAWAWSNFRPVLTQTEEGAPWQSCLKLSAAR